MSIRIRFKRTDEPPGWLVTGGLNENWGRGETLRDALVDWAESLAEAYDHLNAHRDHLGTSLRHELWTFESQLNERE